MKYFIFALLICDFSNAFDCKISVRNNNEKSETTYDFDSRLENKTLEIKEILPLKCEIDILNKKDSVKFAMAISCYLSDKEKTSLSTSGGGVIGENNIPVSMVISKKKNMHEIEVRCR